MNKLTKQSKQDRPKLDRRDEIVLLVIALMVPLVTLPTMIGL